MSLGHLGKERWMGNDGSWIDNKKRGIFRHYENKEKMSISFYFCQRVYVILKRKGK